jgi:GT2 family glycosyltransferase
MTAPASDQPIAVRHYEAGDGADRADVVLGASREGFAYARALVLAEYHGVPWGVLDLRVPGGVLSGDAVTRAAEARVAAGMWPSPELLAHDAPSTRIRVVVPTCRNPQRVVRAVASLLRGPDPDLEIVVVENRPTGSTVARVLEETFPGESRVTCRDEHRPGLSRARNCGAEGAEEGLVGFLDDDIVAHPLWVPAMRAAAAGPDEAPVGVLAGRILPMGLENAAQLFFHRFTGFGENDLPATYRLDPPPDGNPLYPYAPGMFGSGASLCFPVDAFRAMGGFDERLGTGTPSRGGEDLDIFVRALYLGYAVRYVPQAVIWHDHPDSLEGLPSKIYSYGFGLSAMLTKHAVAGPDRVGFLRRIPSGVHHFMDPSSSKNASKSLDYPRRLALMELLGVAAGPVGYAKSCWRARSEPAS